MAQFGFDGNDIALLEKFEFGFACDGDMSNEQVQIVRATLEDYIKTEDIAGEAGDAAAAKVALGKM